MISGLITGLLVVVLLMAALAFGFAIGMCASLVVIQKKGYQSYDEIPQKEEPTWKL